MILLAGGTGHLGRVVVEVLAGRGMPVRILSRKTARAGEPIGSGVELATGDVRVPSSLAPALAGVDTVISAITGFGPGGDGPRVVDLEGNRNLIAAAAHAGAKHFVLISIHGASATHPMALYRAKAEAEERLRASGLELTIIRPTVFMELWAGIVGDSMLKGGKATVFGRGQNPINFVSVRDVARFVELAVVDRRLRGTTLDVGGPENLTLNQLVDILAASGDRPPEARHIPLTALRIGSLVMRPFRPDLAGVIQAAVLMDSADMSFDVARTSAQFPQIQMTRLIEVVRPKSALSL